MDTLDALKTQVDELKERLGTSDAQQESEAGDFKTLLTAIKSGLQTKQAEIERLAAENGQLRQMLNDALSTVREHQVQANGNVLRDLHAEMAALVEPIGADVPDEAESASAPEQPSEAKPEQSSEAKPEQPEPAPAVDAEDSPALRRIMHRGRGGR